MRLLVTFALAAGCAVAWQAQPENTADLEADYLRMIAKWSGNREDAVRAWRQRLAAYTELAPMLVISRRADVPPLELVKQRDNGMTWGDIARDRNVRLAAGLDPIDEFNVFVLARTYRRPADEVRAMRKPGMNFLALHQELQRTEKSKSQSQSPR